METSIWVPSTYKHLITEGVGMGRVFREGNRLERRKDKSSSQSGPSFSECEFCLFCSVCMCVYVCEWDQEKI